jgi:hypothetical protein
VRYLFRSPAADRLGWILDGMNGAAGWGGDVAEVLAPEFAALVPPGPSSWWSSASARTGSCTGRGWNAGSAASPAGTRAATGPMPSGG